MGKGRKALAGTHEAREFVRNGRLSEVLSEGTKNSEYQLSEQGKHRILKAVKFGLGIKDAGDVETKEVKEGLALEGVDPDEEISQVIEKEKFTSFLDNKIEYFRKDLPFE